MEMLKSYWDRSFSDWRYRLTLHIGFWLFFLSSWLDETMVVKISPNQHLLVTFTGAILVWYLFYGLVYLIWPLAARKKWLAFAGAIIGYYTIGVVLRGYHIDLIVKWYNLHQTNISGGEFFKNLYENQLKPFKFFKAIFSGFASLVAIIYIPLTMKFLRYAYQFSQQQAWMQKENTQLQLNTLKAQLNPHFFFNTLNNLQSFIVQNEKEKSVDLLSRLADFMRSSLYDGEKEMISIEKEIDLVRNYISIEKVRFEENATIDFQLASTDNHFQIPPFLLLPFIENVFKHGGNLPAEEVQIAIQIFNSPEKLVLQTKNTFYPTSAAVNQSGGIGLKNVRTRLDYYFHQRYQLDISTFANSYNLTLTILK